MKHKILIFIESLSGGGAEQVLVTLLKHFDFNQYEVTLMTMSDVGVHLEDIDFSKVHYRTIIPRKQNAISMIWYKIKYKLLYHYLPAWIVAQLIMPKGYDSYIAFAEGYCTKIIGALSSTIRRIAYVHTDLKNYPWTLQKRIYKTLAEEQDTYNRYDKVVCVSHSVEEVMKLHYGLRNCTTIYNPIDVDSICRKGAKDIDFEPIGGFNIVSVGRLVPQKGYNNLIPIISRLRNDGIDAHLYILGEGECRIDLEQQIASLDLHEYIHLLGYQKNPYAIVSKMDVFVCSSLAEGYSLAIAEAMCLGVPVISTRCSGPTDLLSNGEYGILCSDYEQMYQCIKDLALSPILLTELSNKALSRRKWFGVKVALDQLYNLL